MRGRWRRRLGAYLLALCLCLSLLPAAAWATDGGDQPGETVPPSGSTDGSEGPPITETKPGEPDEPGPVEPVEPPEPQAPVAYLVYSWDEEKGEPSATTQTVDNYETVTANDTAWGTAEQTTWYVVSGEVTIGSVDVPARVTVTGTVNLILSDACLLTVHGGIQVAEGSTLTIYGQSQNTGTLVAAAGSGNAGIGGNADESCGNITIRGGKVEATGSADVEGGGADAGGSDDGSSTDGSTDDSGSTGGGGHRLRRERQHRLHVGYCHLRHGGDHAL